MTLRTEIILYLNYLALVHALVLVPDPPDAEAPNAVALVHLEDKIEPKNFHHYFPLRSVITIISPHVAKKNTPTPTTPLSLSSSFP